MIIEKGSTRMGKVEIIAKKYEGELNLGVDQGLE